MFVAIKKSVYRVSAISEINVEDNVITVRYLPNPDRPIKPSYLVFANVEEAEQEFANIRQQLFELKCLAQGRDRAKVSVILNNK